MDKEIKEELDKIFEEEEKERKLDEAIKRIPVVGYIDENGNTVLPRSEYDPEDDIWDEIYKKEYPNEKI